MDLVPTEQSQGSSYAAAPMMSTHNAPNALPNAQNPNHPSFRRFVHRAYYAHATYMYMADVWIEGNVLRERVR